MPAARAWFEEPVSSDDLAGLHEVRAAVACDVAAGEHGYDLACSERMCAPGAVDCLQVDVTRCGGATEWLRAAAAPGTACPCGRPPRRTGRHDDPDAGRGRRPPRAGSPVLELRLYIFCINTQVVSA